MMHEIYPGKSESGANGLFDTIGTTLSWDRRHKMIKVTINLQMSLSIVAVVAFPMKSGIIFMQKQATSRKNKNV